MKKFCDDEDSVKWFLSKKIKLLLQMKKYNEAVNIIRKLKRMGENPVIDFDEKDLLIRIALKNKTSQQSISLEAALATILMLGFSRNILFGPGWDEENEQVVTIYSGKNELTELDKEIPGLIDILKNIIREEDFQAIMNVYQEYVVSFRFPGIDNSILYIP